MSEFPSLPLFTDAFLADTGHLSAQSTGSYLLLLMMAWRLPDCRLPDDDTKLSRWARVDLRTWRRIKPEIMEFWALSDGSWTQKRLTKEREIVSKRAEVARQNGQHGGRPKMLKTNNTDNPTGSSWVTQEKAPNPNPIKEPSSLRSEGAREGGRGSRLPNDWKPEPIDWQMAEETLGSSQAVIYELEKFRDFWRGKPGKDGTKLNWSATWRNWCRRSVEMRGRGPPSARVNGALPRPGSREDRQERLSNVLASIDPRLRSDADDESGGEGAFPSADRLIPFGKPN